MPPTHKIILKIYGGEQLDDWETKEVERWRDEGFVSQDIFERVNVGEAAPDIAMCKELVLVIGRRGAKTFMTGIIVSWEMHKLLLKPDPKAHYGIRSDIYVACCATTKDQIKATVYASIRDCVIKNPWFTPYLSFVGKQEIRFSTQADKQEMDRLRKQRKLKEDIASVGIEIFSARAFATGRGRAFIVAVFDEFAWFQTTEGMDNAEEVYTAFVPATKTFGEDARLISLSSPRFPHGMFHKLYGRAFSLEGDDFKIPEEGTRPLGFHLPTWEMYRNAERTWGSKEFVPRFCLTKEDLMKDTDVLYGTPEWEREYGAVFQTAIDRFIPEWAIKRMFDEAVNRNWTFQEHGSHRFFYHGHGDPAKNGASFALALAHREEDVVFIDRIWAFRVAKGANDREREYETMFPPQIDAIDYGKVEEKVKEWALDFDIKKFTFDQFNSIGLIQNCQKYCHTIGKAHTRFDEQTFHANYIWEIYNKLKNALVGETPKLVCPPHAYLSLELNNLINDNGKIKKDKNGAVATKDIADCIAVVLARCLEKEEPVPHDGQRTTGIRGGHFNMPRPGVVNGSF